VRTVLIFFYRLVTNQIFSHRLTLLVSESDGLYVGERLVAESVLSGYGTPLRARTRTILSLIPHCMKFIGEIRNLILISTTDILSNISYKENDQKSIITDSGEVQYNSPSYGPISVIEMDALTQQDINIIEVSVIVSAIHLILEYCSRNCNTPVELEVIIDELASVLEIPSDGALMKDFPVDYSSKQIEVDTLPQKLREELPEILLILQATNHLLEIVKDMKRRGLGEKRPLLREKNLSRVRSFELILFYVFEINF
jgi:hypothetical protein